MRTTYHGPLAAVSLLLAFSRVGLATHHSETTTVTSIEKETITSTAQETIISTAQETVVSTAQETIVSTAQETVLSTVQQTVISTAQETTTILANPANASNITGTVPLAGAPSPATTVPTPNLTPAPTAIAVSALASPSQSQLYFTIAVGQGELLNLAENGPPSGVFRIQPRVASPQDGSVPASGQDIIVAVEAQPNTTMTMMVDPAAAGFLGGSPPDTTVDLPITIIFLILFIGGAFTHISIYKANSKRGHKFLLSDLMFDFCMVRTVTCIFRIIWIFTQPRGVVACAQLFFNGGAAVIFAVNIILTQRIVRSMHPRLGWSRGFSIGTRILALSVPVNIIFQISSLIGLFFSVGVQSRLDAFSDMLKVGSSWNLFLVSFPFLAISAACAVPGPRPEKFGVGSLRVKTSMILLSAVMLGTGATVRAYATFNPQPSNTDDVLFSKAVFYPTQFTLEILVVAMYALLRFDLLFHIPNGSSAPGDYSHGKDGDPEKAQLLTRADIEERIATCGVPHQILKTSYENDSTLPGAEPPVYAIFFPSTVVKASSQAVEAAMQDGNVPARPKRVSRRQSLIEALERKAERDRKAVGRADRRSVASRRSHWGYAHLRKGSSSGFSNYSERTRGDRSSSPEGSLSRQDIRRTIVFDPIRSEEWALPEYPLDRK